MAAAAIQLVRTIRLDDAVIAEILTRLDVATKPAAQDRRAGRRFRYRVKGCVMHVQGKGATSPTAFVIHTQNISATGLAFLHGGFVYPGTRCVLRLVAADGRAKNVEATIVRCAYLQANVHHVAARFRHKIDPADFCDGAVRRRVLLVDDDPSMIRLAGTLLRSMNAEVDTAGDGEAGVEMASRQTYDAILMDIDMPGLSGIEAVGQLRSRGYTGLIVACTALTQADDRQKCLDAGFDRYLPKPFDRKQLAKLLQTPGCPRLVSTLAGDTSMASLVVDFVRELPPKIRAIEEALASERLDDLQTACRSLKGEAGGYGFEPISAAAGAVEAALLRGESAPALRTLAGELIRLCGLAGGASADGDKPATQ